jgi:hypothetical protein
MFPLTHWPQQKNGKHCQVPLVGFVRLNRQRQRKEEKFASLIDQKGLTEFVEFILILDSYTVNQSITDYSIGAIDDAQVLVDYHVNAKNEFNIFMDSNTFNNLRRGLRDTLQMIYDFYYTNNGDYSVKWAFQALDDPIKHKEDRKSTRQNSSHDGVSRMPSSA